MTTRRRFLLGAGVVGIGSLSGCSVFSQEGSSASQTPTSTSGEQTTTTSRTSTPEPARVAATAGKKSLYEWCNPGAFAGLPEIPDNFEPNATVAKSKVLNLKGIGDVNQLSAAANSAFEIEQGLGLISELTGNQAHQIPASAADAHVVSRIGLGTYISDFDPETAVANISDALGTSATKKGELWVFEVGDGRLLVINQSAVFRTVRLSAKEEEIFRNSLSSASLFRTTNPIIKTTLSVPTESRISGARVIQAAGYPNSKLEEAGFDSIPPALVETHVVEENEDSVSVNEIVVDHTGFDNPAETFVTERWKATGVQVNIRDTSEGELYRTVRFDISRSDYATLVEALSVV